MAANRSAANPYQWTDGTWHSIPNARHEQNVNANNPNAPNLGQIAAAGGVQQPAAAPAPGPAPQPYDPGYEAYKLTAGRNVTLGNNEATWQTQNLGYDSGFNADGTLNTSNPYSQAQLLQDNYKRSQLGTTNSMAAQGQLYSGANLNAQATNDRNYAQGYAGLQHGAATGYHAIQSGQLTNYANNAVGVSDASWNSLLNSTYKGA